MEGGESIANVHRIPVYQKLNPRDILEFKILTRPQFQMSFHLG
jgi:hypothetical protein